MMYAKHLEEARARRNSNHAKRERSSDGSSSNNRLEIQDKPRFKKRVPNQVPSKFPKSHNYRCLTLSLKREEVLAHQTRSRLVKSVARSIMVMPCWDKQLLWVWQEWPQG